LLPFVGFFVFLIVIFWSFAASIVALEHALDVTTVRAFVVAIISAVAIGVVLSVVFSVLGFPLPTGMPVQPAG
ncbi:MAG: hypothetical protein KC442_18435, partial [Thermomicrobiales bacterium]|nr:hypothetical protein [Thermomicrobiales bacterium]